MISKLKRRGKKFDCVKGAVCGPVTTTLGLADQDKRPIFYDVDMRDAAVKLLAMKARWQVRGLAPYCSKVLIFQDEPVLAGFGTSAYLSLTTDDVIAMCDEINDAIHEEGALSGIHCCGNTDWAMVMAATGLKCPDCPGELVRAGQVDLGTSVQVVLVCEKCGRPTSVFK